MKILIVEDEKELGETVTSFLEEQGHRCDLADTFLAAEDKLAVYEYEVVILDINLPGGNGFQLLENFKERYPRTGVLIVSARNSLDDKLTGLDLGADDYITKPFHLSELNSRIRAITRRSLFNGSSKIKFNEIEIDPVAIQVCVNGQSIDLTKTEFDLLLYFITNKNRVLTKDSIADHLWGDKAEAAGGNDLLYTHIKNLRKKIEAKGGNNYVKNVYGAGYKYSDQ